jgi:hypothetical protein
MNYILKKIEKKIYINNLLLLLLKKIYIFQNIIFFNFSLNFKFKNFIKKFLLESGLIKKYK